MAAPLRSTLSQVWAFLCVITILSWWLGTRGDGNGYRIMSIGVLLIALIKTRFVIWHFMEVRFAPSWLRRTCDAWLMFVFAMIFAFYWYA
jgi:cytochrome c oxidase subunit 4